MFHIKTVKHIKLLIILVFAFDNTIASCINKTVGSNDLVQVSIGETLPNVPFEKFGNKYYYFGAIFKGNYFEAIQFCSYHGMTLLSIETKEENIFLWSKFKTFLGAENYHFWTSGTTLPGASWIWLGTGRPVLFSNWSPGQPDNAGGKERCLEAVYVHTDKAMVWNDHVCDEPKHVICETLNVKCTSQSVVDNDSSAIIFEDRSISKTTDISKQRGFIQ